MFRVINAVESDVVERGIRDARGAVGAFDAELVAGETNAPFKAFRGDW